MMTMQHTQARSNIYALLSRILIQELDVETLDIIKSDSEMLALMPHLRDWEMLKALESGTLLEQHLNPDFINLSLLHLIPYETFYTRDDQMVETGGANPVTDIYSAYDFMVDFEVARVVSSDHIGVELEFMHHLCEAQIKAEFEHDEAAVADLRAVEYTFLNTHLIRWAPLYLLNVKYEARTPLYADAADMAIEFILSDHEFLAGVQAAA
jgi:putative dimethyl sulfoxide reductase chaperone